MSGISTHVLDTVTGKPAESVRVRLEKQQDAGWIAVSDGVTDGDGRCRDLAVDSAAGVYRITFETGDYLTQLGRTSIYPQISITFNCDGNAHYHLPLLLSDNSYTTYRGS